MEKETRCYDVAVIGGGPGGLPAALEAARHGARVLLAEKNGYLGGNLTIGLPLLGYLDKDGNRIVGGIAQEFADELARRGAAGPHTWCPLHNSVTIYDHEAFKIMALQRCLEAGVDLLFHTQVLQAEAEDGRLKSVVLFGKSRRIEVRARVFIDATGDGDLACMAGASYEKGEGDRRAVQPATQMCALGGVNLEQTISYLEEHPEQMELPESMAIYPGYDPAYLRANAKYHVLVGMRGIFRELRDRGELPVDRDTMIYITSLVPGRVHINCTRHLRVDGSDVLDLTRAEIEGQLQNYALVDVLRRHVPGFGGCYLERVFPFVGVRESRRFKGTARLTGEAVESGLVGADAVGLGGYIIDIHDGGGAGTVIRKVPPYGLPYGMACSAEIENLMFSGRCASMDRTALSSARVMPTLMVLAQGAGLGAALAAGRGISPGAVDTASLRAILEREQAILSPAGAAGGAGAGSPAGRA
ncbi:MAG: FAD-dependent oxidoreductase [Dysosmobacter sp.]|nr:FAD-dependent oxidoreductase [Dysosmobacter sp.]